MEMELVVVDQAVCVTPDSDPDLVEAVPARSITVNARQHKPVAAAAINRAGALVLRLPAGDHKPLVTRALEVQIAGIEVEGGRPGRYARAVLVLRYKTETGLAGCIRHLSVSTRR